MNRRILACVASLGLFVLMASTQVSSVYSALTAHITSSASQQISSATWSAFAVESNTATTLLPILNNIKRNNDPGRGTYFSIRNLGTAAINSMKISVLSSNNVGNGSVTLAWCDGFTWDETTGTCNGSTTGNILLTAPPRVSTSLEWSRSLPINGTIRMRIQRNAGSTPTTDTTITIDISRSYLRGGVNQIN